MSEQQAPIDPDLRRYLDALERYDRADFEPALREIWDACNAGEKPLPVAVLSARSERAPLWRETFDGRLWMPIRSSVPHWGTRPDGTRALFYHGDLERISRKQIGRVVAAHVQRFSMSAWDVEATIFDGDHGLPVLADEVLPIGELAGLLDYLASC